MRISFHGPRPAGSQSTEPQSANERTPLFRPAAAGHADSTREINLLCCTVAIHRRTARQSALLEQLSSGQRGDAGSNAAPVAQAISREASVDAAHSSSPSSAGSRNATPIAQSPARSEDNAALFAEWDGWAQAGGANGGNRAAAAHRMREWVAADQSGQMLSLTNLGLTSLPENWPASLMRLNVSVNQLRSLPENLPASLTVLMALDNLLERMPENVPPSLSNLNVDRNQLTELPQNLPDTLRFIFARGNQLTSLPEQIPDMLRRGCEVGLEGNPLPDEVFNNLQSIMNAPEHEVAAVNRSRPPARPLVAAVADWHAGEHANDRAGIVATWQAFASEEGAGEFSKFLDYLYRDNVNNSDPAFKDSIVDWLADLARRPSLRQLSFLVSVDASTRCEDRVSLTLNDMNKARLLADVEDGHFDRHLDELVPLARSMFRMDKLEAIAARKNASLHRSVEDDEAVEVHLAYQAKLADKLQLPVQASDMRFFGASSVTQADLDAAERDVKALENETFVHYLSTDWKPWQSVMKRLDPPAHEAAQERLIDALSGDVFEERINDVLAGPGLQNNEDARRTAGVQVKTQIAHEINDALTRQFLESRNLSHLLAPKWT